MTGAAPETRPSEGGVRRRGASSETTDGERSQGTMLVFHAKFECSTSVSAKTVHHFAYLTQTGEACQPS